MPLDVPRHGLIAVLLITRPKSGPKLVFHYPSQPIQRQGHSSTRQHHQDSDDDSDDDSNRDQKARNHRHVHDEPALEASHEVHESTTDSKVLGYAVDTPEKLLSPGRWSDRKKFEICLDETTFVGHPVHANEDGVWSTKASAAGQATIPRLGEEVASNDAISSNSTTNVRPPDTQAASKPPPDFAHVSESLDSHPGPSLATSFASNSTTSALPPEQLTMFHVVFALQRNSQDDTRVIYEQVAKKLSKALQYCQKQNSYLSMEHRKLVALKTKARQSGANTESILSSMIEGSELAWSLKEVYEKIAISNIADIRLNGTDMSLHIPPQPLTHNSSPQPTPTTPPSSNSALLLLEDKSVLLRRLSHPDASPLAHFIRDHTPTKTLQKLSTRLNTPLPTLLSLTNHLITWHKALPIPPLHARNTYVVSPTAPTERLLQDLIPLYANKFPTLPTLPQMLKVLSGRPIQYGLLIPSKDHRAPYMDILAFLLRYGLVVQMRRFGWLRGGDGTRTAGVENEMHGKLDAGEKIKRPPVSGLSLLSPQLRPVHEVRDEDPNADDDARSVRSAETAITAIPSLPPTDSHTHTHSTRTPDSATTNIPEPEAETPTGLILHPLDPSDEEKKILQHITSSIRDDDDELREYLPTLLKYLDGEHALEDIAVAEGLKRARVEEWLDLLQKRGWLQTFRAL